MRQAPGAEWMCDVRKNDTVGKEEGLRCRSFGGRQFMALHTVTRDQRLDWSWLRRRRNGGLRNRRRSAQPDRRTFLRQHSPDQGDGLVTNRVAPPRHWCGGWSRGRLLIP